MSAIAENPQVIGSNTNSQFRLGRMDGRGVAVAVCLLALIGLALSAGGADAQAQPSCGDSYPYLTVDGVTASAVGLDWSSGPGCWSNDYSIYVQYQSGGAWQYVGGSNNGNAFFLGDLAPSESLSIYVVDASSCWGSTCYEDSNTVQVETAHAPILSQVVDSANSITLGWSYAGTYSGIVGFSQYSILEKPLYIVNGSWQYIENLSTYSTNEFTIQGLSESFSAEFYLQVWDYCVACSGTYESESWSSAILAHTYTPPPPPPPSPPPTSTTASGSSNNRGTPNELLIVIPLVLVVAAVAIYVGVRKGRKGKSPPTLNPPFPHGSAVWPPTSVNGQPTTE